MMKWLTRKRVSLLLQALSIAGVFVGMIAGFCLLWEITDIAMLDGILYTMQPDEQLRILHDAADQLVDDGIEYGLVAGAALLLSAISGTASFILTCFIKTYPEQAAKEI